MEMPSADAASRTLLDVYGSFHVAVLEGDSHARDILAEFRARQLGLKTATDATAGAVAAANAAEALRGAAETEVERLVMRLQLVMLGGVGKKTDRDPYKTAFPGGLTDATRPKGHAQVAEATRICDYIAPTGRDAPAGTPAEAATIAAELRAATLVLDARCDAEDAANFGADGAFLTELSERRLWRDQYRKDHGLLTALYPNDKKKVESFFKRPSGGKNGKKKSDTDRPSAG